MASKSEKRRRKRRLVHQGVVPADEAEAVAAEEAPADAAVEPAPVKVKAPARKSSGPRRAERNLDDDRPPAPWGNFPLVEIAVLIGIVMVIIGLVLLGTGSDRGPIFIIVGLALASIGGLELAVREHFAGFRSHTLILAGLPAAVVLALLYYAGPSDLPVLARVAIAAVVFSAAAAYLIRVFRNRSGGHSFRFSGFKPPR